MFHSCLNLPEGMLYPSGFGAENIPINSLNSKRLTPTRSLAVTLNSFLGKRLSIQKNRRVCGGIGRKTRRQNASMKQTPKKKTASLIQPSTVVSYPNLQCSYSCISNCNGLKTRKHIVMSIGFSQEFAGFTAIIGLRIRPIAH